jgi:hypothetical protein
MHVMFAAMRMNPIWPLLCLLALVAPGEEPLRNLDSGFPMQSVANIADWPQRQAEIRLRILVAAGLHPVPLRTPLKPIVHGKVERAEYSVERVILESFPGHYLTGSLYRPKGFSGKRPALLTPHGHWKDGRFYDHGEARMKQEIETGGERFAVGGRHPIQARCVQLARMGCIVFNYDMEGYADSVQLGHRCPPRGPGLLGSPQAELQGQTIFGLQTWNSIRALDFLASLPDVDGERIGVTGASGGGTQSMIISAIDRRVAVAFPAVMVSEDMQGGCTCENASHLRISQGNIDIAAATAPRPLGLIAADDWTRGLETRGHPQLSSLYERLGEADRYEAHFHIQFKHNFNAVNRQHLYHFVNRHFQLGLPEPIEERDYQPLDPVTEASVWTETQPKPTGDQVGEAHERQLLAAWTAASTAAWAAMDEQSTALVVRDGLRILIGPVANSATGDVLQLDKLELPAKARLIHQGNGKLAWQHSACYTYGYNTTPLAAAIQAVLAKSPGKIVASSPEAGLVAHIARALTGIPVETDAVFDLDQIEQLDHPMLLPGLGRYLPFMPVQ